MSHANCPECGNILEDSYCDYCNKNVTSRCEYCGYDYWTKDSDADDKDRFCSIDCETEWIAEDEGNE